MAQHGGTSILLARFFAPVRAVVPLVAGTTQMARAKFYVINAASALAWAPAHILPGVLFGTSLRMAEAVSARLAVILLVLGVLLWLAAKVARIAMRHGVPLLAVGRDRALQWASRRPGALSRLALFLFDPRKPESPLLIALGLLLGGGWTFFGILQDVAARDPLVLADVAIFNFLQDLRIAEMDRIMVVITGLGGAWVALPLVVAVWAWLAWARCWRTARYWLAVAGFFEVLVQLLKYTLARTRPISLYSGVADFSFPSGHATSSIVIYGFLAFLLSRKQRSAVQGAIAAVAAVYIALIGFSRLYLGAHWFSDVMAGLSLGLAWVALAAMAYSRRPSPENLHPLGLGLTALLAVMISGPWYMVNYVSSDLARYARQTPAKTFSPAQWLDAGWRELPRQRMEIGGDTEEPLPLQWADSASSLPGHLAAGGLACSARLVGANGLAVADRRCAAQDAARAAQIPPGQQVGIGICGVRPGPPHAAADSAAVALGLQRAQPCQPGAGTPLVWRAPH
ncbi:Membrane-associated phospholipid phosphatase [Polaromonas sp. CG9_12]|nr:Membrane-associated phospholipid phosphatase [Polaromonas sp. CG9_12]